MDDNNVATKIVLHRDRALTDAPLQTQCGRLVLVYPHCLQSTEWLLRMINGRYGVYRTNSGPRHRAM